MSKLRGTISHRLAYFGYRAFESLLKLVPLPACFIAGQLLGHGAYYAFGPYRRLARRNLHIAFEGEMDEREIHALTRQHFSTLGSNLLSSIKLTTMRERQVHERLQIEGAEHVRAATEAGHGALYLISHLGAWEILAQVGAAVPDVKRSTLYQPLSNPYLDAHVRARRERSGTRTFDRKAGFNAPIKFTRDGGALGILVDQHAGDLGTWCPLFGRLASTSNLAPLIAARTGAKMFPISVATVGVARWKMTIGAPLEVPKGEPLEHTTARMNLEIEAAIRRSPADWFWVHNRWKTPNPKFLLTSYKRGIVLPPGMASADLKPFRILLRSPNPLGDACMAVPAVRAIRRGRPDAQISVLCPVNLVGFWSSVSEIHAVIPRPRSASNRTIAKTLRAAGPFDVAILCPNSPRAAIEARRAGIPRIVGYPARWRDRLVDQLIPPRDASKGPRPHHVTHYLKIAQRIGADISEDSLFDPPPSTIEPVPSRIGISPGAEYGAAKCWPVDRFAAAATLIAKKLPDARFALFGTPSEAAIGTQLSDAIGDRAENLIGATDLPGLMDELRRCAVLITNDTGTMHLAAFLGVPTVALFGSTEPAWTSPLGKGHHVLRHHVPCSPCFLRDCPLDFACMNAITPEQVAAAVFRVVG